jgi:hypothetical protein
VATIFQREEKDVAKVGEIPYKSSDSFLASS